MKPTLKIVHPQPAPGASGTRCPSCHALAPGAYCSRCGESTVVHSPSAGEFIHEFVGHYVAFEGKLWTTLRLLILKPGRLTAEFMRGRRVPYINPLRLYLTLSLVMFGLIKMNGVDLPQVSFDRSTYVFFYTHKAAHPDDPKKVGTVELALTGRDTVAVGERTWADAALTFLDTHNASWAKNARQFMQTPPREKAALLHQGFLAHLPYMLIGALPLFALYLKLLYWRSARRYGEHLVFALHVSAFAFLLASAMILIPGNLVWLLVAAYQAEFWAISAWDYVQLLIVVWSLAYLPAALRAVYGGGRWRAWATSLVLTGVHLAVILGLVIGAECIAILEHG